MAGADLSFHPILRRKSRRKKLHPADISYLKRVEKNRAKARREELRVQRITEERENQMRYQQLRIQRGELTQEDMDWLARTFAMERAIAHRRRSRKLSATPKWANKEKIDAIFLDAARLQQLTGIMYHVDHIVPLVSKKVCGLHCEQNLQILTNFENISKNNRHWPDMW